MKKIGLIITLAVFLTIIGVVSAWAAPYVYVKNQPITDRNVSSGEVFVNLEEFLTKANYSWKIDGTTIEIFSHAGDRPKIQAKPIQFKYNKKTFDNRGYMGSNNKYYVEAKTFGHQVDLAYSWTADTNTLDFYSRVPAPRAAKPAVQTTSTRSSGGGKASNVQADVETASEDGEESDKPKKGKMVTIKTVDKSLIKPVNDFFFDFRTGEVRGEVHYKNSSNKQVNKVSIKFMIVDGYDEPLNTLNHNLGDMKAGAESKKFEYFYLNPSNFTINEDSFKYEFTYEEPIEEKKEEEKE